MSSCHHLNWGDEDADAGGLLGGSALSDMAQFTALNSSHEARKLRIVRTRFPEIAVPCI